jgi:glycosyltransferase involved in cell wall biosynthesis
MKNHDSLEPRVEILIPTWNRANFLVEAVTSALMQDYNHLSVSIVDDCSSDNTPKIAEAICRSDKRVRYFRNDQNVGRVMNHRKALYDYATGDLILMLDDDDLLTDNGFISKAVQLLKVHPDLVMVFANERVVDYQRGVQFVLRMHLPEVLDGNWLFFNFGRRHIGIPHRTTLYDRRLAITNDFYSAKVIGDETESFLRFIINRKVGFFDRIVAEYRLHTTNAVRSQDIDVLVNNLQLYSSVYRYALTAGLPRTRLRCWLARLQVGGVGELFERFFVAHDFPSLMCSIKKAGGKQPVLLFGLLRLLSPRVVAKALLYFVPTLQVKIVGWGPFTDRKSGTQ